MLPGMAAANIHPDLAPLARPIHDLTPYPGNAKLHDLAVIRESLERYGQWRAAVVQEGTGFVVAGNGMLAAALELGWDTLAAVTVTVDDDTARDMLLMDNRSAERGGGYDDDALLELLDAAAAGGRSLAGTGWDAEEHEALRAALDEAAARAGGGLEEVSFTASVEPPPQDELWPEVTFRVAPASHNTWCQHVQEWPHPSDALTALMKGAGWM